MSVFEGAQLWNKMAGQDGGIGNLGGRAGSAQFYQVPVVALVVASHANQPHSKQKATETNPCPRHAGQVALGPIQQSKLIGLAQPRLYTVLAPTTDPRHRVVTRERCPKAVQILNTNFVYSRKYLRLIQFMSFVFTYETIDMLVESRHSYCTLYPR